MPSENRLPFGFRWVKAAMMTVVPGPSDAIFRRHELDIASLVSKPEGFVIARPTRRWCFEGRLLIGHPLSTKS